MQSRLLPERGHLRRVPLGLVCAVVIAGCATDGAPGAKGEPGPRGLAGADGAAGSAGLDGADGADGADGQTVVEEDDDGDGVVFADDCDDDDPTVGAAQLHFLDGDGDGYGTPTVTRTQCGPVSGWVTVGDDCDDLDPAVHPGAAEVCNGGLDDDCDGLADDDDPDADLTDGEAVYPDADFDGYGEEGVPAVRVCDPTDGWAAVAGDCDDALADVNPGMDEVCGNGLDDNCNSTADHCGLPASDDLDAADFTLTASVAASYDYMGRSVAVSDLNGDGVGDLAVSAHGADTGGSYSGAVYVFFGATTLSSTPDAELYGTSRNNYVGYQLDSAGDVNGDGYGDLVVGAYATDAAYVVFGSVTGVRVSADITTVAGAQLSATDPIHYFGYEVQGVGDTNADGYDDVLVVDYGGSSYGGAAYLFAGSSSGLAGSLVAEDDALLSVTDSEASAYLGRPNAVASGDFDGDGHADLSLGAYGDDTHGTTFGTAYVFYGPASGSLSETDADVTFDTSSASGSTGFGYGAAGVGDVNADGYADLAVSSYYESSYAGITYLYFGVSTGWAAAPVYTAADASFTGANASDAFVSPHGLGDVSGDGVDDFAIGGTGYDSSASSAGAVAVFYGAVSGVSGSLSVLDANAFLTGDSGYQYVGHSAAGGDLDGDGWSDLILGAYGHDTNAGKVGVFIGSGL